MGLSIFSFKWNDALRIIISVFPEKCIVFFCKPRFAKEYNALFGEYTYDNSQGVIPLERENGETHLIKAFSSYSNSVKSYFNNINSHYAYQDFRDIRNIMRKRNNFSNINLLVNKLSTYAADKNYIKTVRQVIKTNNFSIFDQKTISY